MTRRRRLIAGSTNRASAYAGVRRASFHQRNWLTPRDDRGVIGSGAMTLLPRMLLALLLLAAPHGAPPADRYPRQPLDVEHYRFALTLSDSTDRVVGEATVRMRLLAAKMTRVELDLAGATPARQGRGMHVSAVTRDGKPLAFTHAADRLAITLDAPSSAGDVVELVVRYAGIPVDGLQIKPNKYGDRTFFSDDWPDKAHNWLPTIDHIADKATMEMDVGGPS